MHESTIKHCVGQCLLQRTLSSSQCNAIPLYHNHWEVHSVSQDTMIDENGYQVCLCFVT